MVTKTIRFIPAYAKRKKKLNPYNLRDAAWNFARTILWFDCSLTGVEVDAAKAHFLAYFKEATDRTRAFMAFCERVILTGKYISAEQGRYVSQPSVWLNRNYEHGFAGTKKWFVQIERKRKFVPGYLSHITVMANHYYNYLLTPSATVFNSCRQQLIQLNATQLLQQYYNVILHLNHSIQ